MAHQGQGERGEVLDAILDGRLIAPKICNANTVGAAIVGDAAVASA